MYEADACIGGKKLNLAFQILWPHHVVLVEEANILSPGQGETTVPVARDTQPLFILVQPHPGVGNGVDNIQSAVRRAVVDHQKLKVSKALRENTLNGLSDKLRSVVGRDAHTDTRRQAHRSLPFPQPVSQYRSTPRGRRNRGCTK